MNRVRETPQNGEEYMINTQFMHFVFMLLVGKVYIHESHGGVLKAVNQGNY